MIEKFHQNIIYDENINQQNTANLRLVQNEDDLYEIGTLCKVQLDKQKIENEEQTLIILKGIERIKKIKMEGQSEIQEKYEISQLSEFEQILNKMQTEEYKTLT